MNMCVGIASPCRARLGCACARPAGGGAACRCPVRRASCVPCRADARGASLPGVSPSARRLGSLRVPELASYGVGDTKLVSQSTQFTQAAPAHCTGLVGGRPARWPLTRSLGRDRTHRGIAQSFHIYGNTYVRQQSKSVHPDRFSCGMWRSTPSSSSKRILAAGRDAHCGEGSAGKGMGSEFV